MTRTRDDPAAGAATSVCRVHAGTTMTGANGAQPVSDLAVRDVTVGGVPVTG